MKGGGNGLRLALREAGFGSLENQKQPLLATKNVPYMLEFA